MPSYASISPEKLARLLGTARAPVIIDVREADALAADARLIPTSRHLDYETAESWAAGYAGRAVAVSCQRGKKLAEGAAAWLLAISLGLSRLHADDLEQLAAGLGIYDALYRWARDATDEVHSWPGGKGAR